MCGGLCSGGNNAVRRLVNGVPLGRNSRGQNPANNKIAGVRWVVSIQECKAVNVDVNSTVVVDQCPLALMRL